MFLILSFLLLGPVTYAAPSSMESTPSSLRHHRVTGPSIGRSLHAWPHVVRVPSAAKMQRVRRNRSFKSTHIFLKPTGALYDIAHTTEDTAETEVSTGSDIGARILLKQDIPALTSTIPFLELSPTATLTFGQFNLTSSYVSLTYTPTPTLDSAQSIVPQGYPHPSVIFPFVGSAIGATSLLLVTVLVVCSCLRVRARRLQSKGIGSSRWFSSDEKEDFIVSIRVPPPTVPLKGILLPSPTTASQSLGDLHPDRVSLTSSQFSAIINNLPKARYSGLKHGVIESVPPGKQNSPVRATRIGPSPSDFLANLFGQSRSFTSSISASSQLISTQSPPRHVELPLTYHQGGQSQSGDVFTPAFPPATASPHLVASSGPRGHSLILTGDQGGLAPSFAQWRYQRSLARDKARNSLSPVPS